MSNFMEKKQFLSIINLTLIASSSKELREEI